MRESAEFIGAAPTQPMPDSFVTTQPRAQTGLPDSRSTGFGATGFGPTVFDTLGGAGAPSPRTRRSVFDVCHVGVVLRALLFVHAVVAIGVMFTAPGFQAWLLAVASGATVALPGVLFWLLVACALKRSLGALPLAWQWAAAVGLGALCAALAAALVWPLAPQLLGDQPLLAPTLAGAGLAAAVFHWLHMRSQAMLPADTTARLAELQSRIRPHFLFNTLNTALALVRVDPPRAEGVLEDLAELFRVALGDGSEATTLADEVELARRYLAIEQIRFGARLRVSWELDPAAGRARVPPLLLQPLVENAVRHGVEPSGEGGSIRVSTSVKPGRAVLSIVNSVGDTASAPGHGIALKNVRERLNLMHDVASQFEARRDGDVFRVQIVVPL